MLEAASLFLFGLLAGSYGFALLLGSFALLVGGNDLDRAQQEQEPALCVLKSPAQEDASHWLHFYKTFLKCAERGGDDPAAASLASFSPDWVLSLPVSLPGFTARHQPATHPALGKALPTNRGSRTGSFVTTVDRIHDCWTNFLSENSLAQQIRKRTISGSWSRLRA